AEPCNWNPSTAAMGLPCRTCSLASERRCDGWKRGHDHRAGSRPVLALLTPQAAVQSVEQGVELGRLREDVGGDAKTLRRADHADIAGGTLVLYPLEIAFHGLKAHQAGIEGVVAGVGQAQLRILGDAVAHTAGQLVDARVDALRSDPAV